MEEIKVRLHSREPHVSQILTGFCRLARIEKDKYKIIMLPGIEQQEGTFVEVFYRGKKLIYDTLDGYQNIYAIAELLKECDFYFKRSYSSQKNEELGLNGSEKMYPLGFNYHVSCPQHPLDKPYWKEWIKHLLGIECNMYSNTYFTAKRFEEIPRSQKKKFTVLFATRLWEADYSLSEQLNEERQYISDMRINIIRSLKKLKNICFIGGISDGSYSRTIAPELILPSGMGDRKTYIKIMHKADICIGTMGLHESIGWKTGEYVAASKAIVNEVFHYKVPGDFVEGRNYISFKNAEECVESVKELLEEPERIYKMKIANKEYYDKYLKPDCLIQNTLNIVDASIENDDFRRQKGRKYDV